MGPVGSGQKTKLVNQVAVMGTIVSMAESMNFAREMGMDVGAVIDVVGSGAAGSWSLNNYGPRVLKGDFAPGFSINLMAKDLRLVRENLAGLKADYGVVLKLTAICEKLVAEGKGHEGLHAVVKALGWVAPPAN
jgi:3-hydroxyisobutyrate dehydrogenase